MNEPWFENPRNRNWFVYSLFCIFKAARMYFVIWAYYFTPVTALFLNLYYNLKQNKNQITDNVNTDQMSIFDDRFTNLLFCGRR